MAGLPGACLPAFVGLTAFVIKRTIESPAPHDLVLFQEEDGSVPALQWLESLPQAARRKCRARLAVLQALGPGLRRPVADYLENGIYELRMRYQRLNLRLLYFFAGRRIVVVTQGFVKQGAAIPRREIDTAIARRERYSNNPQRHTFNPET